MEQIGSVVLRIVSSLQKRTGRAAGTRNSETASPARRCRISPGGSGDRRLPRDGAAKVEGVGRESPAAGNEDAAGPIQSVAFAMSKDRDRSSRAWMNARSLAGDTGPMPVWVKIIAAVLRPRWGTWCRATGVLLQQAPSRRSDAQRGKETRARYVTGAFTASPPAGRWKTPARRRRERGRTTCPRS